MSGPPVRIALHRFELALLGALILTTRSAVAAQPMEPASTGGPPATPATAPPPASPPSTAPAPEAGAPAETWVAPSFSSDPLGAMANATDLTLKMYGDTGFAARNNDHRPWPVATANPNVYAPGVWNAFFAPRLDLFGAADVGKLSFFTEVMFEAENNAIGIDVERLQINYLFANWLRVRAGRTHVAWGYYNDTYHHGNLFELTTSRPYSVNFEDSLGIILSHNVGVGIDGTFDLGRGGSIRYDAEVGNGRAADITSVAVQYAEKNDKAVNVRLRWMPVDGLILGVNGLRDLVPSLAVAGTPTRPATEELIGGAHVVYMENDLHIDIEAFLMRHNPQDLPSTTIYGGFAELGYSIGAFTPYVRPEYMEFPSSGDVVYQYAPDSAEATFAGGQSVYYGTRTFTDLRVGVKWLVVPQLALKLEGERLGRDPSGPYGFGTSGGQNQEIATVKAAFGFW